MLTSIWADSLKTDGEMRCLSALGTSVKRGERRAPTIVLFSCLDDPLVAAELITAQVVDLASIIAGSGGRKVLEPHRCCCHPLRIGRSCTAGQYDFLVGESDLELVVGQHLTIGRLARRRFGVGCVEPGIAPLLA